MFGDLSLFQNLKTKMTWHQARQTVLAENVANADTPYYTARELQPLDLNSTHRRPETFGVELRRTSMGHVAGRIHASADGIRVERGAHGWEITPEGNGVVLEEQMMKVTENQMDYQAASTIYSRAIAMLRGAVAGR